MNKRMSMGFIYFLGAVVCLWHVSAQAARTYTITQTPSPAEFDMGSTQTVAYTITNTSSGGGNICERIYEMRFRLPGTGTVFSSATSAPANWTRTSFSTTSVTFRANSWSDAIDTPAGGGKSCATGQGAVTSVAFNLVLVMRTTSADVTETLRDARARYTLDTNFSNGITRSGTVITNNPGSWTLRSLQVISFQTTDTSNNPVSAIYAGTSFRLVITVKNISSATQSGITASPTPPTTAAPGSKTGTWSGGSPNCSLTGISPSPLNLAPGASGTITYTCTTSSGDSGTVTYATKARNSTNNATSRTVTSNSLAVSAFVATLQVLDVTGTNPVTCVYINQSFMVRMGLLNNYTYGINGITPTLSPTVAGILTLVSGPTTGPGGNSIGAGPGASYTNAFQWIYQVTGGTSGQLFGFTGSATGSAVSPGSGTRTTPTASTISITRAGYDPVVSPASTNASSNNVEITWGITNNGCLPVKSVSITLPVGWPSWGGDAYSLINGTDESWTASGANPLIFTAPAPANYLPLTQGATYSMVLSTPATSGTYTFDLGVTDSADVFSTRPTTVTVNPFNSGTPSLNFTAPGPWREQFQ